MPWPMVSQGMAMVSQGMAFRNLGVPAGAPKNKKKSGGALERLSFFFSAFYMFYLNLKDFKKKKPAAGGPIFFGMFHKNCLVLVSK